MRSSIWRPCSNDPLGDLNPEITYDINHAASVHLAWLAKEVARTALRLFVFLQQLRSGWR